MLKVKTQNGHKIISTEVEIFLEQREVAFLSPSKICENLNFSTETVVNRKSLK